MFTWILPAQYCNFSNQHEYFTSNGLISILQFQLVNFNTSTSTLELQHAKYLQLPLVHFNILTSRLNYNPLTELFQPQHFNSFNFNNSNSMFTVDNFDILILIILLHCLSFNLSSSTCWHQYTHFNISTCNSNISISIF